MHSINNKKAAYTLQKKVEISRKKSTPGCKKYTHTDLETTLIAELSCP
jgi:hypothetical protein